MEQKPPPKHLNDDDVEDIEILKNKKESAILIDKV
jgi:hypothetical protein